MSSDRRFHTDSRLSENFTEQGLSALTGQDPNKWPRYILKELMDNSLETVEENSQNPTIQIHIKGKEKKRSWKPTQIIVRDNGSGISEHRIKKIFEDIDKFGGTKRHYNLPTRGNIGNALMTILGIHGLLNNSLVIKSKDKMHEIMVEEDPLSGDPQIVRNTKTMDINGTEIIADLKNADFGDGRRIMETLSGFVALNPHINFDISINTENIEKVKTFKAVKTPTTQKFNLSKRATTGKPNWFSYSDFKERLKADARADPDLSVDGFVKEFAKVTSRTKRDTILNGREFKNMSVYELATSDEKYIRDLYRRMVTETKRYRTDNLDSTLGSVGKDLQKGLLNYLKFSGKRDDIEELAKKLDGVESIEDLILYYGNGEVVTDGEKDIPFYFELAAVPKNSPGERTELVFGINQSVAYSNPPINLEVEHTSGKEHHYGISSAFSETGHPYIVVANLTCPNITFLDRGKQEFETEPFRKVICDVIGKAVRKIERDFRPKLNDHWKESEPTPRKLTGKAPKGFIKNFVFNNFTKAYNKGTKNGKYTITMRQLFYILRPWFQDTAKEKGYKYSPKASIIDPKPLKLNYRTFSSYVDEYERERLGERLIHRDERGFFVEPHSNKVIDLQTSSVEKYQPDLNKFNNLLFVEKTGFFELIHKDFQLTKKFDIGLINAKGYSTNAGRNLIEKVQRQTDATLYTLTDLDIKGIGIAEDASEPDAFSKLHQFDTERLGVSLEDVKKYDLPVEPVSYSQSVLSELKNKYRKGKIRKELYDFFTENNGKRVEINAFSPVKLEKYLTKKFQEHNIEKVKPEKEDIKEPDIKSIEKIRKNSIKKGVGSYVMSQAGSQIIEQIKNIDFDFDETPAQELEKLSKKGKQEVHKTILEELEKKPPRGWEEIMKETIQETEKDSKQKAERLSQTIQAAVKDFLHDNVKIDVQFTEKDTVTNDL